MSRTAPITILMRLPPAHFGASPNIRKVEIRAVGCLGPSLLDGMERLNAGQRAIMCRTDETRLGGERVCTCVSAIVGHAGDGDLIRGVHQGPQRGSHSAARVGHSGALLGQSFPLALARAAAALTVAHRARRPLGRPAQAVRPV